MSSRYLPLAALLLTGAVPLSGQSTHPARFTAGIRGGLASPNVKLGVDSVYQGDIQVRWQAELGFRMARGMTLGLEAAHHGTPGFAGDSKLRPSPDYTAVSGALQWAIGRESRPRLLLSAGAGVYRVSAEGNPPRNTELGVHAGLEVPLVRLGHTVWLSPAVRADVLPGVPSSGLYVISLTLGLRYWGL